MSTAARIRQIVELVVDCGVEPEVACAQSPELLPSVKMRLAQLRRLDHEITRIFPPDNSGEALDTENRHELPRIDGYEVEAILGRGGMGVVFRGVHLATVRTVAIKMLRFYPWSGTIELERFTREYRLLAQLNHPGIVQVYDVGTAGGQPYFTMQLIAGESLDTIVGNNPQSPAWSAATILQLAEAICAAHTKGIIHRDLKPSNVLFDADGKPHVTDFGLARQTSDGPGLTMTGIGIGTPNYMSPEQAAGRVRDIGPRTDIHALGAILYHLLTGQPPFRGESSADTIQQVITLDPVPPSRLNPKVPRDLETICLKCLEKDSARRFPTVDILCSRLRLFLEGKPIPERPVGRLDRLRRWCRRNPPLSAAIASSLLLLILLAGVSTTFAVRQQKISSQLRSTLNKSLHQEVISAWDLGRKLCESGDVSYGMLVIARALDSVPKEESELRGSLARDLVGWHCRCHTLQQSFLHPNSLLALAVYPDGTEFVTGCEDGIVRCWNLTSGTSRTVGQHNGKVHAVAVDKSEIIVSSGTDRQVCMWNRKTGEKLGHFVGHNAVVNAIAVSPNAALVLTGSDDQTVRLWELSSQECRATFEFPGPVHAVSFSSDGHSFSAGGKGVNGKGEFRVYSDGILGKSAEETLPASDESIGNPVTSGQEHSEWYLVLARSMNRTVRSCAFSSDSRMLIVGDENWDAVFWDLELQQQFASAESAQGTISAAAFSPTGHIALTGTAESRLAVLWDAQRLHDYWDRVQKIGIALSEEWVQAPLFPVIPHPEPVTATLFVPPNGEHFLTACSDGAVRLWRLAPGPQIQVLDHEPRSRSHINREFIVRATAMNDSGTLAATGGDNGLVQLWHVATGVRYGSPIRCSSAVRGVEFSANGDTIITGTSDGCLQEWNVHSKRPVSDAVCPFQSISGLDRCRSDNTLLVAGDGSAQRWSFHPLKPLGTPILHHAKSPEARIAVASSPVADRFLTLGDDGYARLWNSSGRLIAELEHRNLVRGGGFSPDGSLLITASDDHTARVWDAATGAPVATLMHETEVFSAVFTNHELIITGSRLGAQIWDLHLRRPIGPPCKHRGDIMHMTCSQDGRTAILADWYGYGIVWSLPQPIIPAAGGSIHWIQRETGMSQNEEGAFEAMKYDAWRVVAESQ